MSHLQLLHCRGEHGEAAQGGDGVGEVLLGIVQPPDVPADTLHQRLRTRRLGPDVPNLLGQLQDLLLGCSKVMPGHTKYENSRNRCFSIFLFCL